MPRLLPIFAFHGLGILTLICVTPAAAIPPTLAWARAYDGLADDLEIAVAEELDPDGNIYVTGVRNDSEFVTMKLDPTGRVLWTARAPFGFESYYSTSPSAIARDSAGNIIVTGYSTLGENGNDFTTIKYDADGRLLWLNRYDGPAHAADYPSAIGIDQDNNVFITGTSQGVGTDTDFATVKYSANGAEQWVARYDGPAHATDTASAVVIDSLNRIVVVGSSSGGVSGMDIAVVYYDQQGNPIREIRYDGPTPGDDYGFGLAAGQDGAIYVAGSVNGSVSGDGVVLKYTAGGILDWNRFYDGPAHRSDFFRKIFIDGYGHIDAIGGSADLNSFGRPLVVQYDADGNQRWFAQYPAGQYEFTELRGATVDSSGNVDVIFKSPRFDNGNLVTVKYGPEGSQKWIVSYDDPAHGDDGPRGVAVDQAGNVVVLGTASRVPYNTYENPGMVVVKYDSAGSQLFASPLSLRGNGSDEPYGVKVGANGRIYLGGDTWGPYGHDQLFLLCLESGGAPIWQIEYEGPGSRGTWGGYFAVGPSGNAYIAGTSFENGTGYDFVIVKFDPDGNQVWERQYDGFGLDDVLMGITLDADENVYVCGYATKPSPSGFVYSDAVTIKYDAQGNQKWAEHYGGKSGNHALGLSIVLDPAANVLVSTVDSSPSSAYDMGTIKYNKDGVLQWASAYSGGGYSNEFPGALAVDRSGNSYLAGLSEDPNWEFVTVKFFANGSQDWTAHFPIGSGSSYFSSPYAVQVDESGDLYVLAFMDHPNTDVLIKYSPAGVQQWAVSRPSAPYAYSYGEGLVLDSVGNPYVNLSLTDGTTKNMTTIRYDPSGQEQWGASLRGVSGLGGSGVGITLDPGGNVLACGMDNSRGGDILIAKYLNCVMPGDTRISGKVDGGGIRAFLDCLFAGSSGCACADLDGDGAVTVADVQPFVETLLAAP